MPCPYFIYQKGCHTNEYDSLYNYDKSHRIKLQMTHLLPKNPVLYLY